MFVDKLRRRWAEQNTLLCVGLDPDPDRFPEAFRGRKDAIFSFNRAIIDATADLVCAFKPQVAHYSACGAEDQLAATIDYLRREHPGSASCSTPSAATSAPPRRCTRGRLSTAIGQTQ